MTSKTYEIGSLQQYKYVVVLSEYEGNILLSRHKKRTTWETQGGHIEFGEEPFEPVNKPESYHLSERQQILSTEYSSLSNELLNEFINQEERSLTIIAYQVPSIGENFPEIFEEIRKVNTLDNEVYKEIQQNISCKKTFRSKYKSQYRYGSNISKGRFCIHHALIEQIAEAHQKQQLAGFAHSSWHFSQKHL